MATLPQLVTVGDIADVIAPRPIQSSDVAYRGAIWSVRRDRVDLGGGEVVERDVVQHPGAVAVLAQNDEGHVLVVQQYRHPIGALLWELPAGVRDVAGESPFQTGARELAEETGYAADQWQPLLTVHTTPGGSAEELVIVRAAGLRPLDPAILQERTAEERDMPVAFVDPWVAREAILAGRVTSPTMVAGILALTSGLARPA